MKLSIWQQFSSNHSAAFTVVGSFNSQDKAQLAANELEASLGSIAHWWDQLNVEDRMSWGQATETSILTPPEIELSNQYKIEWPFSINWYHWVWDRNKNPITTFKNLVFIENPHPYIWKGPQPFNSLLAQLGSEVFIYANESQSYPNTILLVNVNCLAPDESAAQLIYELVHQFIATDEKHVNPWLAYHNGSLDPRSSELIQIASQGLQQSSIIEKVHRDNLELEQKIRRAKVQRDDELVKRLQDKFDRLVKDALGGKSPINWQEHMWVLSAMSRTSLDHEFIEDFPNQKMTVQKQGENLHFTNFRFESMVSGLRAFSVWLESLGCTDISYTFSQLDDTRGKS